MADVILFDGRVVDSASEAWRAECEARHVLNLPTKAARHDYLNTVSRKRGAASRDALEALGRELWKGRRQVQEARDESA